MEPYWKDGSMDPAKFIVWRAPLQHIAFEHVGYYGRWPKVAKVFSPRQPAQQYQYGINSLRDFRIK